MDVTKFRRTFSLVASAALMTTLTIGAYAAPAAAKPDEQQVAAKQARAEARAEAKAARQVAKEARAAARAEAKVARQAAREAAKLDRAEAKAARKAEKQALREKVDVCHKPGTPAEGTINIARAALQAHLDHDDVEGPCEPSVEAPLSTCEVADASGVDEQDAACEEPAEPQEVVVSIEAPETIGSDETLTLQGAVSGLEGDDLTYDWSSTCLTDEQLTDPTVIASEPDSSLLVIRVDILTPDTTCEFTLTVADEDAEGSATVAVGILALS
jgi:hypothetical protein